MSYRLKESPLFSVLTEDTQRALIDSKCRTFGKNEMVHLEGDACTHIEIVLSGALAVERITLEGNLLAVADFKVGDTLGANLIFSSRPYFPMTVVAKKKTEVLLVDKETLYKLCRTSDAFMRAFITTISDHTVFIGTKIKHHVSRRIRDGICNYLQAQVQLQKTTDIRLTLTKKALAEQMGVSRTSLSRALQKMKEDGLIDYDVHHVYILDADAVLNV